MQKPSKIQENISALSVPSTSRACRNYLIATEFKTKVVEHSKFGQKYSNERWNIS
jgi:hypothetical protein